MGFLGHSLKQLVWRSAWPLAATLTLGIPALCQAGPGFKFHSIQGGGWSRPNLNQASAFAPRPQYQPQATSAFQNVFVPPKQNFQPSFSPAVTQPSPAYQPGPRPNAYPGANALQVYVRPTVNLNTASSIEDHLHQARTFGQQTASSQIHVNSDATTHLAYQSSQSHSGVGKLHQLLPRGGVRKVYAAPRRAYQNSPLYTTWRSEVCWVPSLAR
jgi:hypothetical protein